jgi:hypothetical protein
MEGMLPSILNNLFSERFDIDLSLAKSARKFKESSNEDSNLRATLLRHAKAVQHTFSHIKKTYLPIYLVLDGGEFPPTLRPYTASAKVITRGRKSKKRKVRSKDNEVSSEGEPEKGVGELKWVAEENLDEHM